MCGVRDVTFHFTAPHTLEQLLPPLSLPCLPPFKAHVSLAGMNCYVATVREHVTSGHAMLALSLSDIEKRLGISNPLHRRKLWLAIEEQRNPDGW